jgi:hypothetical protein
MAAPGNAFAASKASLLAIVMRNRPLGSAAPVKSIANLGEKHCECRPFRHTRPYSPVDVDGISGLVHAEQKPDAVT